MKQALIFLLCLHSLYVPGQSQATFDKMVDFMPPPPNAASIIRYGEMSINKNTGSPNISIPIFTLPGKKLSVPVSISYSSGGIRVDEIASRVGMGWN
ncbi:MAG TPA: hypothetical protein VD996_16200, partial [Chitinophagaceae bacterium]|nr:hypothetical protein [Chitinophagaceae bacterium]